MRNKEEIKLIFNTSRGMVFIEFPTKVDNYFTVWHCSSGYGSSSLSKALEYLYKEFPDCTIKELEITATSSISLTNFTKL